MLHEYVFITSLYIITSRHFFYLTVLKWSTPTISESHFKLIANQKLRCFFHSSEIIASTGWWFHTQCHEYSKLILKQIITILQLDLVDGYPRWAPKTPTIGQLRSALAGSEGWSHLSQSSDITMDVLIHALIGVELLAISRIWAQVFLVSLLILEQDLIVNHDAFWDLSEQYQTLTNIPMEGEEGRLRFMFGVYLTAQFLESSFPFFPFLWLWVSCLHPDWKKHSFHSFLTYFNLSLHPHWLVPLAFFFFKVPSSFIIRELP